MSSYTIVLGLVWRTQGKSLVTLLATRRVDTPLMICSFRLQRPAPGAPSACRSLCFQWTPCMLWFNGYKMLLGLLYLRRLFSSCIVVEVKARDVCYLAFQACSVIKQVWIVTLCTLLMASPMILSSAHAAA